jgi:hypothetical protein
MRDCRQIMVHNRCKMMHYKCETDHCSLESAKIQPDMCRFNHATILSHFEIVRLSNAMSQNRQTIFRCQAATRHSIHVKHQTRLETRRCSLVEYCGELRIFQSQFPITNSQLPIASCCFLQPAFFNSDKYLLLSD